MKGTLLPLVRNRGAWRARGLACVCVLAVPALLAAQQADRAQAEAAARRNADRLQALQRESDRLAAEEKTLVGDLAKLDVERQMNAAQLRQLDAQVKLVESDLEATTARSETLERQELAARPELRARLVEIYKLGSAPYLRLLLSTADARRLGDASRAVATLAQLDRARINAHQRTLDELKTTRAALEERRRTLETLRHDTDTAQAAVVRAAQAKNELIRVIDRRRDLDAQLAGELQAAQQKLQATLRDMAAPAAAATSPAVPSAPVTRAVPRIDLTKPVPDVKAAKGELEWPSTGTVRRRFDASAPGRGGSANGIEIAAPEGSPAVAVHEGTVVFADTFSGFGNLVIVDHGSQTFSVYGNLLDIDVKKGSRVDRGQAVGTVGTPPAAPTGAPGLYFELRVDGQPVDPLQWFRKR